MPVKGLNRYFRLIKHISNPISYFLNKVVKADKLLKFSTRKNIIHFEVTQSLYQVFKEIFMTDVYEIDKLISKISSSPSVIDIGANAGFFDIILLSKLPNATIYAYEPLPSNVKYIEKLIKKNPSIVNNLILNQKAVTGKQCSGLDLYVAAGADNQVVASVFNDFDIRNTQKINIPSITLTEIVNQIGVKEIDLLKMDCEGSEYDIIYNTSPSIIKMIKYMVVEVHDLDEYTHNIKYFNSYLESLGFQTIYQPINGFCYALEAVRV